VRVGSRPSAAGPVLLDSGDSLVVSVLSAADGVGRSTVAAILAVALHERTVDRWGRAVAVWVTDPSPARLARTPEAVTSAEQCGLPMREVVAIKDHSGNGWAPRSRRRCTLLADRIGTIVELAADSCDGEWNKNSTGRDLVSAVFLA
jgi:hypothetical protein